MRGGNPAGLLGHANEDVVEVRARLEHDGRLRWLDGGGGGSGAVFSRGGSAGFHIERHGGGVHGDVFFLRGAEEGQLERRELRVLFFRHKDLREADTTRGARWQEGGHLIGVLRAIDVVTSRRIRTPGLGLCEGRGVERIEIADAFDDEFDGERITHR